MTKYKKKSTFIDFKHTTSFVMKFTTVALTTFVSLGVVIFCLLNKRLGHGYVGDISILSSLQEKLGMIFIITATFQAIIFSLIVLILALLWAHAVAGPLIRFQKALIRLSKGELSEEISFRQSDQLHDLASSLNNLHRSYKARWDHLVEYLQKADAILKECVGKGQDLDANYRNRLKYIYYSMLSLLQRNK